VEVLTSRCLLCPLMRCAFPPIADPRRLFINFMIEKLSGLDL
jgi:hypothetical protein